MIEGQSIIQISDYSEIFQIIWGELDINKGRKALDIGIGSKAYSAKMMLDKRFDVIGADIDPLCKDISDELGLPLFICDACSLPFIDDSFNVSLAFFSMHEIDPKKHQDVLLEMKRVSKTAVIVEPLPSTDKIGKIYGEIWQNAMRSAGRYEIYQPMNYWLSMVSKLNPRKILHYKLRPTKSVTKVNAEEFCNQSIEHFKNIGVNQRYCDKLENLSEKIKTAGMKHSNIIIIIGYLK